MNAAPVWDRKLRKDRKSMSGRNTYRDREKNKEQLWPWISHDCVSKNLFQLFLAQNIRRLFLFGGLKIFFFHCHPTISQKVFQMRSAVITAQRTLSLLLTDSLVLRRGCRKHYLRLVYSALFFLPSCSHWHLYSLASAGFTAWRCAHHCFFLKRSRVCLRMLDIQGLNKFLV